MSCEEEEEEGGKYLRDLGEREGGRYNGDVFRYHILISRCDSSVELGTSACGGEGSWTACLVAGCRDWTCPEFFFYESTR